MEPTWDSAAEELAKQERALWNAEWEMRVRTDSMTSIEKREFKKRKNWDNHEQCLKDTEKLVSFFGCTTRATSAHKRLCQWMDKTDPTFPGQVSKWYSTAFTLGKHQLLAERASMNVSLGVPKSVIHCRCFAATYLMRAGCVHLKNSPHS